MIIHYDKLELIVATTPTTSSLRQKMSFQEQYGALDILHHCLVPTCYGLTSLVSFICAHLVYAVNTVSHSSVEVRSLKSRLLVRNNKRLLQICAAVRGRLKAKQSEEKEICRLWSCGCGPILYLVWCQTVAGVSLDAAHKL